MAGDRWRIEIRHPGLNKYRMITGTDKYVVEQKANAQLAAWDEMWERRQEAEANRLAREQAAQNKESMKQFADEKTIEAEAKVEELQNVLNHTLEIDDTVDWDLLMDKSEFPEQKPNAPSQEMYPAEPSESEIMYQVRFGLLDRLSKKRRATKQASAHMRFVEDHNRWEQKKAKTDELNERRRKDHEVNIAAWETRKAAFISEQEKSNQSILLKKKSYFNKDPDAISDYCEMVLSNSEYPSEFPQQWDLEYRAETGILLVEYQLPSPDMIPTAKSFKYVAARNAIEEKSLTESIRNQLYDSLLYQIALRTIHELFEADATEAIVAINFNGWVRSIDKGTGKEVTACIMSVQAKRDEFQEINLANVDPKTCFKQLKGVGSSKLHGMASVAPIMQIDRSDTRFIDARGIADMIEESSNLAAMDWQDFEHLIRELFEQEFVSAGGEVKITQASSDGGVDAIAFDPDPIRGGKIVIQAKRYTNVVGVAAVRDLYGTTLNEGATKGILVTTSDYGPDAYSFAKDKPITLLNGSNLLHLLEKHGRKARIDLKEAKKLMADAGK